MKPARYRQYTLESVFQPIFSLCHRRTVGFEALLRPISDRSGLIAPRDLIGVATANGELRHLDSLCQALHIQNFASQESHDRWLFLNVEPNTITRRWYDDGTLFEALRQAGIPPQQVVIEILEGRIDDEPALLDAITFFRDAGAQVALDDFGAGHSNFDRLWRVAPDIIKLDRELIVEAEQHRTSRLRRILPNLVSLMHEAGSLVLCEGVETEAQAMVALESDVDFVQGFYFGRPRDHIDEANSAAGEQLADLTAHYVTTATVQESLETQQLAPYIEAFRDALGRLATTQDLAGAARSLVDLPRTARVYLLDWRGEEISHVNARHITPLQQLRMAPIADSRGGVWYRRQYFRAAVNEPDRLQISRPYLSSTGGYMCVTLSIAVNGPEGRVACCDVAW